MSTWEPSRDADQMREGDIRLHLLNTIGATGDVSRFLLAYDRLHNDDVYRMVRVG